ncbi:hypothetical protein [Nitratireductor pacificus]|uniref:Uncharacterized protein n=1 Tax=Nitratireductor pacificus pht-3B TaxID=391937 RepID=K2MES6_9HYPH|nr:hypothetical protein [Nitratireductor pacificus]EKF19220.1 hypothetical protein NA2_08821 [Nitratireductor pacificus pht-3B]
MALIIRLLAVLREFIAPRYHPERHYMRGPGPACRKRSDGSPKAA